MTRTLDEVLADHREEAAVLRKHKQFSTAEAIERICDEVAVQTEEWRRFLSEGEAILRSGHTREWLRSRFPGWEQNGHARRNGTQRQYRMCVVPARANTSAAYEAGRRAAGESA
jgi:hypothetical protein